MKLPYPDALPLPMFIAGPDGTIEDCNAAFDRLLPGRRGTAWTDVFAGIDPSTLNGGWKAGPEGPSLTVTASAVVTGDERRFFDIICRPAVTAENSPGSPGVTAVDAGAGPARLIGMLIDVTEQSRRQAEIYAILEAAVDAIIMIDETGLVETFNRAAEKLFGYSQAEIIGQPVALLMPEPHRTSHDHYMQRFLQTGERRIIGIGRELEAQTKTGSIVPIYLAVSEILLQGQRRFAGIIRDLSEQRATREALTEQRERLAHVGRLSTMGEMTASIAHEINQPLTAISMYAQAGVKLIQRGDPDLVKLTTALDKLNTQSLRAGAIIERIQRFARAQESQRELLMLNDSLRELVKLAEGDARLHDVTITFDLQQDLPAVYCDPIQIQQVALNLIRNAIDAMKAIDCVHGNALRISSRAVAGDRVEVAVADQGPGVAPDQQKLLFKAFHTTKKDGMGMGLSICRTIIAEHGGELSFRNNSDAAGRSEAAGATFFFTLPAGTPAQDQR